MASTPESSAHTSIKYRLELPNTNRGSHQNLENFVGIKEGLIGIPFKLKDYLELVDWTGRIIQEDKSGHIDHDLPSILSRLNLNHDAWKVLITEFENRFQCWIGKEHIVKRMYEEHGYKRRPSTKSHKALFQN